MKDDIAALSSTIEKFTRKEKDAGSVLHSGGGSLYSNAMEGLVIKARKEKGLRGGVSKSALLRQLCFQRASSMGNCHFQSSRQKSSVFKDQF